MRKLARPVQDWVHDLNHAIPRLALIMEALSHDMLMRRLFDGALDVVFVYEPPQLEEVLIEEVASIPLIMVSSEPEQSPEQAMESAYVMTDWGHSAALAHARHFPDAPAPERRINQARIALSFLLKCGGATYLAERMVSDYLEQGLLHRVRDAPPITRHAYAVYNRRSMRAELLQRTFNYF